MSTIFGNLGGTSQNTFSIGKKSGNYSNLTNNNGILETDIFSVSELLFEIQSSTPTSPSSGRYKIYIKTDGKFYKLDSDGTETLLAEGIVPAFETSTSNIKMNGTVSTGILSTVPRADHIHPSDTSKIDKILAGINWTSRTSADNNYWTSVCWSPELLLFCAVSLTGTGNRVMTSPDGTTWTLRTSAADNAWASVCWSPELLLFCAVSLTGTGNGVMTSPDGTTWTSRTSAADNDWTSVCWSPELLLFCAVSSTGTGNRVMTSPDGTTWTSRTSAADNTWTSVCWSPELLLFCAVSTSNTGNGVMTSPDGTTWTSRTSVIDNSNSVCWSPELLLFCAVSTSGTGNRVMTSPDGTTWTSRTSAADNDWTSVCWSPELLFCAVSSTGTGNRVMTSPDGTTWTLRTSAADNDWTSVCWSPELLFCAVSSTGTGNRVMTSQKFTIDYIPENVANKELSALDTSTTKYPCNNVVKSAVDAKQNSLGFTPENVANKLTSFQATPDDTHYITEKLAKDQLNLKVDKVTGKELSTNDLTDTLISTWNGKQDSLGFTPENIANKLTSFQATPDDTHYPSEKLVYDNINAKNWIINGNFQIAQRGTSFINPANTSITIDNSKIGYIIGGGSLPTTITHTQEKLTSGEIYNSYYYYRVTTDGAGSLSGDSIYRFSDKRIEHGTRNLCGNGKKITISFYARSSIAGKKFGIYGIQHYGTGGSPSALEAINGTNITLTTSWVKYTYTFTSNTLSGKTFGTDNNDYFSVILVAAYTGVYKTLCSDTVNESFGGSGTTDTAQIGLYQGSYAFPFFPLSYDEELSKCRRYYYNPFESYSRIGQAYYTSGAIYYVLPFPTTMRIAPTTTYGTETTDLEVYSGSSQTGFTFADAIVGKNSLYFSATKSAHGLTTSILRVLSINGISLSSEL